MPRHVGLIMDGNGRWAQKRGHARVFGHVRGAARIRRVVERADELGIKVLTLYAFSTENWRRPASERAVLWRLLRKYLRKEVDHLDRENVQLKVMGQLERLEPEVREEVEQAVERLASNTGLQLVFALSYGARQEIATAAQRYAEDCDQGLRSPEQMNESILEGYLWTQQLGEHRDVDLVIRTSGERRVSNFLLWQSAYAEYHFADVCWPDFGPEHLDQAVRDYGSRTRRFGGVESNSTPQVHG